MDHILVSSIDWLKQHQNRNKNGVFHSGRVSELLVTGNFFTVPQGCPGPHLPACKGKLAEQIILRHSPLYQPTCQCWHCRCHQGQHVKKEKGPAKKQQIRKAKEYTSSTALEMSWLPFTPLLWHCCNWILCPITAQTTLHRKVDKSCAVQNFPWTPKG